MDLRDIIEYKIKSNIKQPIWESWYIKEKIGSGSFSVVYRIEAQRADGIDVAALKIEAITTDGQIFPDSSRKTSFLNAKKQMALNETRIMKNLRDCPYIVRYEEELLRELYIDGNFEGYYNLIRMEYLQNIFDLMKSGRFDCSEENVKKLALEIGQGLKSAHDIGVIHRDIKPENMFVSDKGIYKLGDFNISKKAVSTRSFAGTHYYMAPEIYRAKSSVDESYTQQADIYSLGLCLYQMMNGGSLPFEDSLDPEAAYDKRMQGASIKPPKNASLAFSKIVLKACAFDASSRYRSVDEMITELTGEMRNSEGRKTQYASSKNNVQVSYDNNITQYAEDNTASLYTHKNVPAILVTILIIVGVFIGLLFLLSRCNNQDKMNEQIDSFVVTTNSENNINDIDVSYNSEQVLTNKETSIASTNIETTTSTSTSITTSTTTTETTTTTIPFKKDYLANMELFADGSDGFNLNTFLVDNYRNEYTSSISVDSGYVSYLIKDMGYTHFCGTIALPKDVSPDGARSSAQLEIYIDDVLALRSDVFTNESKPQQFDLDVTGAEVVKIIWSCQGYNIWSNWCYYATVFDPIFTDDAYFITQSTDSSVTTTVAVKDEQYLANMELFADGSSDAGGNKGFLKNVYLTDNYGNTYLSSIGVKSGYLSYLVKDMGYAEFSGTVALPKDVSPDNARLSAQLEIYIDEELAFRSENFSNESKPQQFNLDITNAEVIKIAWTCEGYNVWSNWCYYATVFDGKVAK